MFRVAFFLLSCLLGTACVSTSWAPAEDDPANVASPTTPLPKLGGGLSPDFDPLATPAHRTDGARSDEHLHHQHPEASSSVMTAPAASAGSPHDALADAPRYTCPMHPEVVREEPGKCPLCGMNLVPVKAKKEPRSVP